MFVVYLLLGLLMLVLGAELLVRGGGQLALALRVPALVVGLTIVAFGTSTPELMVSLNAAMSASTEMSLANVNGSNLANVTLVLGLAALVSPLAVERTLMRREIPSCLLLQLCVPLVCLDGVISQGDGVLLLLGGVLYNAWLLFEALRGRAPALDDDELIGEGHTLKHGLLLVFGLGILILGAQFFVDGAVAVAKALHLSDRFIGLTVIALGTSAPEVATGMVSAHRGEVDLAVGNSLGSNLLNIAMVLGVTAIVFPIRITDPGAWTDMAVAFGVTALLVPFVLKGSINRFEGLLLSGSYITYLIGGYFFGDASVP
ncbi:MAG TPA: calcium/sodium antiporter [Deltaproteobacteria bacterium]|nr:calcium/sodium antiporter [Deltaproteobacteria bacterium]